jgi:tetratricopeptide (TPR) repeat protein
MSIFRKKTGKEKLFKMVRKNHFPGGNKQINEKSKEIVRITNDKLTLNEAKSLLLKSTMILVLNSTRVLGFIKKEFGDKLEDEEIRLVVEYIICGSSNEKTKEFIDAGFGTDNMGYDDDELPIGFGEFGRCMTNPIPVRGIASNEVYLRKLVTKDNKKIKWERIGSQISEVKGIDKPIDIYEVFTEDRKESEILYIFPYNRKTSNKAPEGFKIDGGGIVVNSGKDLQNKINRAKEYKDNKKPLEALGIYNQVFSFLCKEAANYANKPGNFGDSGKTREIFPNCFKDAKEFLKKDGLACKISNNMGTIFAETGDIDSAEKMFKQSIDLTPDDMDYKDPIIGLQNLKK